MTQEEKFTEAKAFIAHYKETSFLPALNFEGDLMVSEFKLKNILAVYADNAILKFISDLDNETINKIRNSSGDAEVRRILKLNL